MNNLWKFVVLYMPGAVQTTADLFTFAKCNAATPGAGCAVAWGRNRVGDSMGTVRSVAAHSVANMSGKTVEAWVAVGTVGSASMAAHAGSAPWAFAAVPPSGPATSVDFDGASQTWIAVGLEGTDLSFDGGKHWVHAKKTTAGDEG